jgi:transcription termination factor Rho
VHEAARIDRHGPIEAGGREDEWVDEGDVDRGAPAQHQQQGGRRDDRGAPRGGQHHHDAGGGGRGRRRRQHRRRGGGGEGHGRDRAESAPFKDPYGLDEQPSARGRHPRGGRPSNDPAQLLPATRDPFTELVSIDPDEKIDLETETEEMSMRVVDLITPVGKGQRGLIVAPPKTGKTTLLLQLARAVSENHPEVELIVALIDERPEEVTAFKRAGYGTVIASSNDESVSRHVRVTAEILARAKDLVLQGKDVCILLDSITRVARAHNNWQAGSSRTLSGGLDSRALERPKRFFGAARNILDGGSLTILATALIDTGSRMDEVIFQEFKGTGNMELQLDRRLAEKRIWPAIDIQRSGTRKEEKLFPKDEFEGVVAIRRALSGKPPAEAMQMLLQRLKAYKTNRQFLLDVAKRAAEALT